MITYVPDNSSLQEALARTTHMGFGAHPDDLELLAAHGILACYQAADRWFTGVVLTHGGASPRGGRYQDVNDEEMRRVRIEEQKTAASIGRYSALAMLDHNSAVIRDPADPGPAQDIAHLMRAARPEVVYTHCLTDRHGTHVAAALRVIAACRLLPAQQRPDRLLGCEVWRDLDWLVDQDRLALDCSAHPALQIDLLRAFASQVGGGKRYDRAALGRRQAHAAFQDPYRPDSAEGLIYAMDLTPLIGESPPEVTTFVQGMLDRLAEDVQGRLASFMAPPNPEVT